MSRSNDLSLTYEEVEFEKAWYLLERQQERFNPSKEAAKSVARPKVSHYQQGGIEPIDFINSHKFNFNLGNAIKYITRSNFKGTRRQDLQKAIDYLNFELEGL